MSSPSSDRARTSLAEALMLASLVSEDLTRLMAQSLGASSTGNRDVQLLLLVIDTPGSTPSALSHRLGMTRSATSRALRGLVEDSLVRRQVDPQDRRSSLVYPSHDARARAAELEVDIKQYFVRRADVLRRVVHLLDPTLLRAEEATPAGQVSGPVRQVLRDLGHAGAAYERHVRPVLIHYGLTLLTDRAAIALVHHGGTVRPRALARALHLTTGGTTGVLDRLERADLVHRRRADEAGDRRAVEVACSPRGHEAVEMLLDGLSEHRIPLAQAFERTYTIARTTEVA